MSQTAPSDTTTLDRTRRDYDRWAEDYTAFVHDPDRADPIGRGMITGFAALVGRHGLDRTVLDAGCGPGHLTAELQRQGLTARGIDLSPVMIDIARRDHPGIAFAVGSVLELDVADASLDGVLAHFSLIHTRPDLLPVALAELARVLRPGGHLLVGFMTGDERLTTWVEYDHTVSPAYWWSVDAMAGLLRGAGLAEVARCILQPGNGSRTVGAYLIVRAPVEPAP